MAVKRKFISTRLLHNGMRIDQNIIDGTGRALIAKGAYLDDFQIEYLRTKGIGGIYVSEGEPDADELDLQIPQYTRELIEKSRVPDRPKVQLSDTVKKQIGSSVQKLFADPNSETFSESSVNIANELTDSILRDDAVAIELGMLNVSDEYTFRHSVDVAALSIMIGKTLGLPVEKIRELGISGLLHDVGKAKIPAEVLNKPGKLNDDEFALMKQHTLFGLQILKEKNTFNEPILMGVLQHHEKLNGRGYPQGMSGNAVSEYARIISVADIFDALIAKRVYKDPLAKAETLEMMMGMTQELDRDVLQAFINTVILYPVDSYVTLSNGELAKVVENTPKYPLRPKVIGIKSGKLYNLADDLTAANLVIIN